MPFSGKSKLTRIPIRGSSSDAFDDPRLIFLYQGGKMLTQALGTNAPVIDSPLLILMERKNQHHGSHA
jgi:hypothetical protein